MPDKMMKNTLMSGTIAAAITLAGAAFADSHRVAPKDPAGTPTGQTQRDEVDQRGKGERVDQPGTPTPRDPAGTQTGQTQRDPVESVAPGETADPMRKERIPPLDPAGTQKGQTQRDRVR